MKSEIEKKINPSKILYSQCWEDTDILIEGLNIQPDSICLSIASAGDNSLALLTKNPKKVIALDLNPSQIAIVDLKVAAIKELNHLEFLSFIGVQNCSNRLDIYQKCKKHLHPKSVSYWNENLECIKQGIVYIGKFDNFFNIFRKRMMRFIHSKKTINILFTLTSISQANDFYYNTWNNLRWRFLFKIFFSEFIVKRFGRNPDFFKYVQDNLSKKMLERTVQAMTEQIPKENPYLYWILNGNYSNVLPYYLRKPNFQLIKNNIDKLEYHLLSIEDYLKKNSNQKIDVFNLSDIFEYMNQTNFKYLYKTILEAGKAGSRLAYWNFLVPRSCPDQYKKQIKSLSELASTLSKKDKTFFYSRFVLEEIK